MTIAEENKMKNEKPGEKIIKYITVTTPPITGFK